MNNERKKQEGDIKNAIIKIIKSGGLSFCKGMGLYLLIMSILKGKLNKQIIKRALSISSFLSISNSIQIFFHEKQLLDGNLHPNRKELAYYSTGISGIIGGIIAISIDRSIAKNHPLVLWFFLKAIRNILNDFSWGQSISNIPYMSTIIMCLSASQILTTWKRYPGEIDQGYKRFLDVHGGQTLSTYKKFYAPNFVANARDHILPNPSQSPYSFFLVDFFPKAFRRALKVYIPLYSAQFLLSVMKMLWSRFMKNNNNINDKNNNDNNKKATPNEILLKHFIRSFVHFLTNICQSSLFLSVYCTLGWAQTVINPIYNWSSRGVTRRTLILTEWVAGLATLLERVERRGELAIYCATFALHSILFRFFLYPNPKNVTSPTKLSPSLRNFLAKRRLAIVDVVFNFVLIFSVSTLLHYQSKMKNASKLTSWLLCLHTAKHD